MEQIAILAGNQQIASVFLRRADGISLPDRDLAALGFICKANARTLFRC